MWAVLIWQHLSLNSQSLTGEIQKKKRGGLFTTQKLLHIHHQGCVQHPEPTILHEKKYDVCVSLDGSLDISTAWCTVDDILQTS